jgi:hypothetical protein
MRRILIKFLIIISFLTNDCFSQNVGYLGKKIHMNLDLNIMPNYRIGSNYSSSSGLKVMNLNPFLNLNFILGRRFEIGLSYGLDFVSLDPKKYEYDFDYNSDAFYSVEKLKGRYSFSDIHFRIFQKAYIAPFGYYCQFSFGMANSKFKDDSFDRIEYDNYNDVYDTITYNLINQRVPRVGFGLGKRVGFKKGYYFNALFQYTYHISADKRVSSLMKSEHFYNIRLGFGKVF